MSGFLFCCATRIQPHKQILPDVKVLPVSPGFKDVFELGIWHVLEIVCYETHRRWKSPMTERQVLKFHLRDMGIGKSCSTGQIFISTVNWAILGVSFHVVRDKGRVWMSVGGGEECDGMQGEGFNGTGTYKHVCVCICVLPREEDAHIQHPLLSTACKRLTWG